MNQYQSDKYNGQIKMNIAPFVTCHRPQRLYLGRAPAAAKTLTMPAPRAGRQNILDYKAGTRQRKQTYKANEIYNKIQCRSFDHVYHLKKCIIKIQKSITTKGYVTSIT